VGTDLLDRVVEAMIRELAFEMYKISDDARKLAGTIIFRSLRIERFSIFNM